LVIVIIWQGLVRRPTAPAYGTALHMPPNPIAYNGGDTLRVATFNIAGGVSPVDNRYDLDRTAKYLHSFDLIGLEEVHGAAAFDWRDEAEILGDTLHMPYLFAPSERRWWHDSFGNGILCDLPVTAWQRLPLSTSLSASNRSMLRVAMTWHNHPVSVIITHLDRHEDHDIELGAIIAAFNDSPQPAILLGDLNTDQTDPQLSALRHDPTVTDALAVGLNGNVPTTNDWIFTRGLRCVAGGLTDNDASDHKLAWAQLAEEK
jgi:endonuclease/exonuclease/phosphatase family metal-dependent hydrolase